VYKVALADTVFPDNNNAAVELREVPEIRFVSLKDA
jgi:hypothetical protein